jgi:hypothetical protein
MTARKYPKDPKDPKQEPSEPDQERRGPNSEGREHQVHKEILERRMTGGPEPTPEAYARALEQWKDLPGSIVRPPTDVTPPPAEEEPSKPSEPADQGGSSTSKPKADKQNDDKEH